MGVIRKKSGTRGTEGGCKYICDVCSADITSTVRIHCADPECNDYDLCVPCFGKGASSREHKPATHAFSVIEQHSIPIYNKEWGADEEALLLEGSETYGLGSWADIADHIGGMRTKEEVRDHYVKTYVESKNFPLPDRADPFDLSLTEDISREEFQATKKRRIEERKEAQKNAPPAAPKQKPTSSVPSCHEVQGYMPGRLEFEAELHNEAEEFVQHMQFEPGEGALNPRTGAAEPEFELKMATMDIYNGKLTERAQRKKAIFEHNLLEYRKNQNQEKKKTKEERELFNKAKPFARLMNHEDFKDFVDGLEYEQHLRQAIAQLHDWRAHGIGDLKTGEKYEQEKAQRLARPPPIAAFDRMPGARPPKQPVTNEVPQAVKDLLIPELPERLKAAMRPASALAAALRDGAAKSAAHTLSTLTPSSAAPNKSDTNGINGTAQVLPRSPYTPAPIPGIVPLKLTNSMADLQLLTKEERELCSVARLTPKAYIAIKEAILKEAVRHSGVLKRKQVRELLRLEPTKSQRIWELFVRAGWIGKG